MGVNMCEEKYISVLQKYITKINKQKDLLSHELHQVLRTPQQNKKKTIEDIHQWKTLALGDVYRRFYFLCFQARAV